MPLILFLVCLAASGVGSIAGYGGGVIIKPVLDALHILPVSTISFLSGYTVLSMSIISLRRQGGCWASGSLSWSAPALTKTCWGWSSPFCCWPPQRWFGSTL